MILADRDLVEQGAGMCFIQQHASLPVAEHTTIGAGLTNVHQFQVSNMPQLDQCYV